MGCLLALACLSVAAEELELWPGRLCDVRAHKDSSFERGARDEVFVKTGTVYNWPGVTIFLKAGAMDLSAYGEIRVSISNSADKAQTVICVVKNRSHKEGTPRGGVMLKPGAQGEISVKLRSTPWILDQPMGLVGMRGYPVALGEGVFNILETAEFHLVLAMPTEDSSFTILGVRAVKMALELLPSATFLPFVDQFGQFRHAQWTGKVESAADLARAHAAEEQWLTQHAEGPSAERSRWGGWLKGPQRTASGHFRTEKNDGKWWLVDPDGRLFFSHGIDCVRASAATGIDHRANYFAWLPPEQHSEYSAFYGKSHWAPNGFYKDHLPFKTFDFAKANLLRKYGSEWSTTLGELAHRRIRAWGLNTVGNWSDSKIYLLRRTPYTVCLNTAGPRIEGSTGWWGKFPDPFSAEFSGTIQQRAEAQKRDGTTDDPWCIGYFVDNELSWGNNEHELALAALRSPKTQPAKVELRRWLEQRYANVATLNQAWGSDYPSWEALMECTEAPPIKHCVKDLADFNVVIAERYFAVVSSAVRTAAPQKLYLGCRIAWGPPSVYRAAAKYCDVVSVNIYSKNVTRDLPDNSLDKPMINGEFHFGALDRGMFHTGLVPTENQQERAQCYIDFVESCLQHPRYVGTHWFQWRDQALTGRGDGENFQIGFLTITDAPYPELVEAARKIGATMYAKRYGSL